MTLGELRTLLDDLQTTEGFGPDTQVFFDDPIHGLQEPMLYTSERFADGALVIIIERPRDNIDEVS